MEPTNNQYSRSFPYTLHVYVTVVISLYVVTSLVIDTYSVEENTSPPESTTTTTTVETTSTATTTTTITIRPPNPTPGPQNDQPRCSKLVQADLIFGLFGIGNADMQSVSTFVKEVGSGNDLQSGKVRLGLKEDCGNATLKLMKYQTGEDFSSAVSNAMYTKLSSLLFRIRHGFGFTQRNTERLVILVISGSVQDMEEAYVEAKRLKFKATVIVVGFGKGIDTDQLKKLASYKVRSEPDISHVFPVSKSADLPYIVKKLHRLMCAE